MVQQKVNKVLYNTDIEGNISQTLRHLKKRIKEHILKCLLIYFKDKTARKTQS